VAALAPTLQAEHVRLGHTFGVLLGNGNGTLQPSVDGPIANARTLPSWPTSTATDRRDIALVDFRGVAVLRGRCLQ
jgi:hypothetical protein